MSMYKCRELCVPKCRLHGGPPVMNGQRVILVGAKNNVLSSHVSLCCHVAFTPQEMLFQRSVKFLHRHRK